MSKKSRRRNKKILGALLLGGLGLAARNKRNAAIDAGIKSAEDDSGSDMLEFKEKIVTTPKAITGTKKAITGTKFPGENKGRVYPKLKVSEKGYVTKNGVAQGFTGPGQFITDDGIFVKGKKVGETAPKSILVRKDGTIKAGGKEYYNRNQYRTRNKKPAMLSPDRTYTPPVEDIFTGSGVDEIYQSARKGGRIVKGKKTAVRTGAAKRGFGRAYMKGTK